MVGSVFCAFCSCFPSIFYFLSDTVLCVAACADYVFSASQDLSILAWSHKDVREEDEWVYQLASEPSFLHRQYQQVHRMTGHTGSVLALECRCAVGDDEAVLFSSSSDCTLRVWRVGGNFAPLVVLSFLGSF